MERKLCLLQCDASNNLLFPLPPPTHPSPCFLAETSGGGKPFPPPASGRPPCVPGIHPWNCSPHLKREKSRVWLDKTKIRWLEVTLCKPSATRVAKCQGYGGYVHVKKLEGWSKKSGRIHSLQNQVLFWVNLSNQYEILCSNKDYMIECSAFLP